MPDANPTSSPPTGKNLGDSPTEEGTMSEEKKLGTLGRITNLGGTHER